MSEYIEPPAPKYFDDAPDGDCRFCGEIIYKKNGKINLRSDWHKECIEEHRLIYDPVAMRNAVWDRDSGYCDECGKKCGLRGWEIDYVYSLDLSDLSLWKIDNIRTLCHACHKAVPGSTAMLRDQARIAQKLHMDKTGTRPKKGRTKPRNR